MLNRSTRGASFAGIIISRARKLDEAQKSSFTRCCLFSPPGWLAESAGELRNNEKNPRRPRYDERKEERFLFLARLPTFVIRLPITCAPSQFSRGPFFFLRARLPYRDSSTGEGRSLSAKSSGGKMSAVALIPR